jgi:uncharacterized protein (DUF885 family)
MRSVVLAAALALALAGAAQAQPAAPTVAPAAPAAAVATRDAAFTAVVDEQFDARARLSPEFLTALGIKDRYGELDDRTAAADEAALALSERQLAELRTRFPVATLSPAAQTSFRLFESEVARAREGRRFRELGYVFGANDNPATDLPVFLINQHAVASEADARAYVSRLQAAERALGEMATELTTRAAAGVVPPAFVFPLAIGDTRNVLGGAPFTAGEDTALWADFQKKVRDLKLPAATEAALLADGRAALTGPFRRGYDRVLTALAAVQPKATSNDGVWRLPDGQAYYENQLRFWTTTDLTADQIHQTGLSEVARIQREMEAIKTRVGFTGSLQAFFEHVKTGQQFQYPNTPEGKAAYLADAKAFIAGAMAEAPQYFRVLPRAALDVRAVEPWREASAPVAFYNRSTPDGSRPGIFYVNLADMSQVLKPQVEGIAYHEGAPGHHFQLALSQETQGLPKFRRFGFYGAYIEGWGLYAERLGKEMGFYQDPYSDFGRLSLELWRAARLVVDTGVHSKRWSREQGITYFTQNTLLSERDIVKEVERYLTTPGQATSYKIGQLKILELRDKARTVLGDRFDIRDFHEVVLGEGAAPLDRLEERVDAYVARKLREGA